MVIHSNKFCFLLTSFIMTFLQNIKIGAKKMKKKLQPTVSTRDVFASSSGSVIGNDPYSMMRRSHSSSSGASHGASSPNFGNMFQKVNSMFGVANATTPSPTPSSTSNSSQKH